MTDLRLAAAWDSTATDARRFPADFRWGLATAAYQIEGGAREGGRGPSIWDTFSHTPGLSHHGDTGDIACDHFHRWEADLDLLANLGATDYRLSVSWSRLQPSGAGELNGEAVAFYRDLLAGLTARGIRPLVTLYHWDLPQPLEDAGGWPARETAYRFADYARLVVAALGDLAEDWITLNEPWCSSFLGYGSGAHAPGRSNTRDAVAAAHHLNLAHGLAVAAIRAERPEVRVGITNIVTDIRAASDSAADAAAAARLDATSNRLFLDPVYLGAYSESVWETLGEFGLRQVVQPGDEAIIAAPTDFAGINHYQRVIAWHDEGAGAFQVGERPAEPATTSFGWSVIPASLTAVLTRVAREFTALPLYVTENGASFHDYVDPNGEVVDTERVEYLDGYLSAAADAIEQGVDLRGYYAWSFLDNFEWAEGYSKRFGLVYVDYRTQERIPKLSARWYRRLIAEHQAGASAPS
ncbi:GH1 family beta-glucosidase [Leifsonia sp. H3M29-4]|uniref:GH1 family beta-glucosidase n=1 Tax=Salinibacterium metalliresistens TaxID=3031321 RepID=UPI0023DA6E48|nr:GH1 family beta-glucosidase [Salinibacterium metalliresistens]MDF1478100.1 GH1 family beta-glucosidase [Salinibacterium metalliresistens]